MVNGDVAGMESRRTRPSRISATAAPRRRAVVDGYLTDLDGGVGVLARHSALAALAKEIETVAPLEGRHTREDVEGWLRDVGFEVVAVLPGLGWRAIGRRPDSDS